MNETTVRKIVSDEVKDLKTDVRRIGLMQEQHTEILQAIGEGISHIAGIEGKLESIDGRLTRMEDDIDVIKHVVKDHSHDIAKLKSKQT